MPLDIARTLFQPDGRIDPGSLAMSVFESRLKLPAAVIVELARHRGVGAGLGAGLAALGGSAVDLVHEHVNHASARLLAALNGELRPDAPLPPEVHGMFEQAQAQRERLAETLETDDGDDDGLIEFSDGLTMLSESDSYAVELDELPAELRGEAGGDMA